MEHQLFKCDECESIYKTKVEKCEGCNQENFSEIDDITLDVIVLLIKDYECKGDTSDGVAEYWDVFEYVKDFIGEGVYGQFKKALEIAEERNIASKIERIYYPD